MSFIEFKQNIAGKIKQINGLLTNPMKFKTILIFFNRIDINKAVIHIPKLKFNTKSCDKM